MINSQEKMHLVNNGCAALTSPIVIRWNNCHFAGSTSPPLNSEKRISGILLGHSFYQIKCLVKFKMIRLEWLGQGWLSCPGANTQALQPQRCHFNLIAFNLSLCLSLFWFTTPYNLHCHLVKYSLSIWSTVTHY